MTTAPIDPALSSYVDIAVADLAQRLSIEASAITVVSATQVQWPDGSLGCPQPGMVYTQVMTDGTKIVLSASGMSYAYHSGGSRQPFLCIQDLSATPITG